MRAFSRFLVMACIASAASGAAIAQRPLPPQPPSWTNAVTPFRIAGNIFYVGSEGLAAYLIRTSRGAILIDGTSAENAPLIEHNIQSVGVSLSDVELLLSDHAHHDHVGALARIKADTGATFLASRGDRRALEHGRPRGDNAYVATPFPPIKVDRELRDGEVLKLGGVKLKVVATPGHTPGCTSYLTDITDGGKRLRVLFLCSITVAGNVLVDNRAYPTIAEDYRRTFARLRRLKVDIVLPSHPEWVDLIGKSRSKAKSEASPFVDTHALQGILDAAQQEFDTEINAKRRTP